MIDDDTMLWLDAFPRDRDAAHERGLAWQSERLGPGAGWLGRLDDEVHLRDGERLHRVQLRHGRTSSESASW